MRGQKLAQERIERINKLLEIIGTCDGGAKKDVLIAQICINWGTNERTIQTYLKQLKLVGKIKEENGLIWLNNPEN